jgi:hypothetical protein
MKSYFLKLSDREEGPYTEEQVSQLFADGRINRNTSCRIAPDGSWKTVDDLLPMLKYGTQLPNPTPAPALPRLIATTPGAAATTPVPADVRVSVVDFDLPFYSILKLMFKWMAAGMIVWVCFLPVAIMIVFIIMAIFGSLLGHLFSSFPHP